MSEQHKLWLFDAVKAAYAGMTGQTKKMTDQGMWAIKAAPMQSFDGAKLGTSGAETKRPYADRGEIANKIKRCNGRSKSTPLPDGDSA
ncbi:hypothetical protein [Deinococcus ruber]|uniref:hypothetical protein n=1 Tax=Deinococcus ruber TaxID=1848197 RepID=UPI00166B0CE4|nr:hypothetical protein [Deinococcus ruber]